MHRAEQIIQAAVSIIEAQADVAAAVFAHRTLTQSAVDQELPAICVNDGTDYPTSDTGYSNLAYVDSNLRLDLSLYAQGSSQQEVATALYRLRSVVHRALLADPRDLALPLIVMGVAYGGADKPVYTTEGDPLAGRLDCFFTVAYRMNLTDPD